MMDLNDQFRLIEDSLKTGMDKHLSGIFGLILSGCVKRIEASTWRSILYLILSYLEEKHNCYIEISWNFIKESDNNIFSVFDKDMIDHTFMVSYYGEDGVECKYFHEAERYKTTLECLENSVQHALNMINGKDD